ncbi:hypothetical protein T4B_760 [Trichinella pseudospiralis]|nr:hypothetical protein T4A_11899 [Trichinella pseudospiralis]KRZ26256.1 hypothetical protein T4B_760 [Trichinella pseudospiralis]KRZ35439.1 hypothetical protein T4C_4147 [Trichinella pseudospiralis]
MTLYAHNEVHAQYSTAQLIPADRLLAATLFSLGHSIYISIIPAGQRPLLSSADCPKFVPFPNAVYLLIQYINRLLDNGRRGSSLIGCIIIAPHTSASYP